MKLTTLLLIASLLPAASPRTNQPDMTMPNGVVIIEPPAHHHSHKKLWVTIGAFAAAGLATGLVLAEEQHKQNPNWHAITCADCFGKVGR